MIERKIQKLIKEIEAIESSFYGKEEQDLGQKYFLLQVKRDQVVRGIILELHLSIENLLNGFIKNYFLWANQKINANDCGANQSLLIL